MLFNHHCCHRLTNHGLRFHIGSPLGSHTVRLLAASIILQRGGTRKEFTVDGLLRLWHQLVVPVTRLEMMKLFVMMVQVMIRLLSGLERRTQFRLNGWRSRWCSRLLVMMLTEDERSDHAKCRAFDEVGLTDVACEAACVEQVIPTAHDELVGLQLVSTLGAMLSAAK